MTTWPPCDRPIQLLLVEDDPADVRLMLEVLRESPLRHSTRVVSDGREALSILRGEPPHASGSRPDLVLLDLNLPGMHGREVLAAIKQDPEILEIPVVVLTTSNRPEDIQRAYRDRANGFVTKPSDLGEFIESVRSLERFWFGAARLPGRAG